MPRIIFFALVVLVLISACSADDKNHSKSSIDPKYSIHIIKLESKLEGMGFYIILQKPFVVIGDETPKTVKMRAEKTVKWAVTKLKKLYFKKNPEQILDIWLFKNKTSYRKHAKEFFGDTPDTPYGYFSSRNNALIMNIATGGGTLIHEIVHPFIEANFPECPSWFNEGLASLYEQCSEKNGRIVGLTNWRLKGLQKAIINKSIPSFEKLCSTTTDEFYEKDPGTNYSQARYLCYYLQEKGLLTKYYHSFVKSVKQDQTGYKTLKKILNRDDMDLFMKEWERFVLKLKF